MEQHKVRALGQHLWASLGFPLMVQDGSTVGSNTSSYKYIQTQEGASTEFLFTNGENIPRSPHRLPFIPHWLGWGRISSPPPVTGKKKGISWISLNWSMCRWNVHETHGHSVPGQNQGTVSKEEEWAIGEAKYTVWGSRDFWPDNSWGWCQLFNSISRVLSSLRILIFISSHFFFKNCFSDFLTAQFPSPTPCLGGCN